MKKILCLVIVAASGAFATSAIAQSAPQIDRHVARMRKFLHLSGQQAGTIRGDYFAASNEKKAIEKNRNLSPMDKQARIREIDRGRNQQIAAVLSPGQLRAWRESRDARSPLGGF